jgi:hypothetical protein
MRKKKRETNWTAVGVILSAIIAMAGGAWWVFSSLFIEQISVCVGEYSENCPAVHSVQLGCGGNIDAWANNTCYFHRKPRLTLNVGGNRCGYYVWDVTCIFRR